MSIGVYSPLGRSKNWRIHLVLLVIASVGLWGLGRVTGIDRVLRAPWPGVHHVWLPALGLLVYALGWLCRGLWLAMMNPDLAKHWPDIDAAWNDMQSALARTEVGIDLVPTCLVLGPLSNGTQTLLTTTLGAGRLTMRAGTPFHAFARPDAIFIVCDGLSHLAGRADGTRLQYLCKLLDRECETMAAVQGVLCIVPFGARRDVVRDMQADLGAIRQATGFETPVYLAVEGVELAGPDGWRLPFPLRPDLDPADIPAMFQDGIDWFCLEHIATDIRSRYGLSRPLQENIRLLLGLSAIYDWRGRLKQLMLEGTQTDQSTPGVIAGCYILPSGESKVFANNLLADLANNQDSAMVTEIPAAKRAA